MPDFGEVSRRVETLARDPIAVKSVGDVDDYPIYRVDLKNDENVPFLVLLTAGIHGDEPATVEAALRFAERDHAPWLRHFRFVLFPCLNPTGYVRNTRENRHGVDLNRAFDNDSDAEVRIIKEAVADLQARCAIDFHEDYEADGFYLFEGRREETLAPTGNAVIGRVSELGAIASVAEDYDAPATPGVYPIFEEWGTVGLAPYLLKYHTPHTLLFETPTAWDMERRVAAHLAGLDAVLTRYLDL